MSDKIVKISADEFTAHHDECLAIIEKLNDYKTRLSMLPILADAMEELANRLDKSISNLPAKFD